MLIYDYIMLVLSMQEGKKKQNVRMVLSKTTRIAIVDTVE